MGKQWKRATLDGFEQGYRKGDSWHPSVAMAILLNEADGFGSLPECQPQGAWCRVKAAISALDGVLAAEREAGVVAGRVKFTVTWSFATRESIDGKLRGPGNYGFQDMVAGIQDPQIGKYSPRNSLGDLQEAFRTRWVHGLNTKSPWNFVRDIISKDYRQFLPIPWFIAEYGASGQDEASIRADLESMQAHALADPAFVGAAFLQFQTNYLKGGAAMDYGMFGLGDGELGSTGQVCEPGYGCRRWPVHCLTTDLTWLEGTKAHRAQAAATAWGGFIDDSSLCSDSRRLAATVGTHVACQIRADAVKDGARVVSAALRGEDFEAMIVSRTESLLGGSIALHGSLSLASTAVWTRENASSRGESGMGIAQPWVVVVAGSAVAVLLAVSVFFATRRKSQPARSSSADQNV